MRFYKYLYVSDLIESKKETIIDKLKKGGFPLTSYIIVLIEEGENQLEFYSSAMLYQHNLTTDDLFVVGIAAGHTDAIYMIEEITDEVYRNTGNVDIRSYILEKEIE